MTTSFETFSPALHDLIPADAEAERVAAGFAFTEGPVWRDGVLLFSDINNNRIVRWRGLPEGPEVTTFALGQSNGLTLDNDGDLIAAEHGGRRVSRVAADGSRQVLADDYDGRRLNSPNDVVVHSNGSIYFTDPPYALYLVDGRIPSGATRPPGWWKGDLPGRELDFNGLYRLAPDGRLELLRDDFELPNGLAFSPDESVLYVDDSNQRHIRAFDVQPDGSLSNDRVLLDMASPDEGAPDGMKVDLQGNIFCTGPGGIWVCRPTGELLGRVFLPEQPANLAWGDEDGSSLFVTTRTSVYRLRTSTQGRLLGKG